MKPPAAHRYVATASVKHAKRGTGLVQLVFELDEPLDRWSRIEAAQEAAKPIVEDKQGYPRGSVLDLFFVNWTEIKPDD